MPNVIYISSHEPGPSKIHSGAPDWIPSVLAVLEAGGCERHGANRFSCLRDGSLMWFQKYAGSQTSDQGVPPVLEDFLKSL